MQRSEFCLDHDTPCWVDFTVLEGVICATKKNTVVNMFSQQQTLTRYDHVYNSSMNDIGVINPYILKSTIQNKAHD